MKALFFFFFSLQQNDLTQQSNPPRTSWVGLLFLFFIFYYNKFWSSVELGISQPLILSDDIPNA